MTYIDRLLLLLFLSGSTLGFTQSYLDIAKFSFSSTPQNQLKNDSLKLNSPTQLIDFGVDLTAPIVLKNNNVIISGIVYEQTNLKTDLSNNFIYTINPKIGYKKTITSQLSSTLILLPKLSSDIKNVSSNHFQIGGVVLFDKIKNENLKYKFGLYYNQELFGPFVVPLLGLYYLSSNKKLEANLTLPVFAAINYSLSENIKTGISFNSFVRSYYLGNTQNQYLVKTSNELFGVLQVHSKATNLVLEPQIGYSIGRSFRNYYEDDQIDFGFSTFKFGDQRTQLNQDFKDGLIFKVRLLYRFMIDND